MSYLNSFAGKLFGIKSQVLIILIVTFLLLTATYAHGNPEAKFGDINEDGVVDVEDVVLVIKHILGIESFDEDQQKVADVNEDGVIDVKDVNLITKYWLGLIDKLPVVAESPFEDEDKPGVSPPDHVYENDAESPAENVYNS